MGRTRRGFPQTSNVSFSLVNSWKMAELFPIIISRKSRPFTWSSDFVVATKRPGNRGSKSDNRFSTTSLDVTKVSILHVLFCCNRFVLNFDPNYFLLFSTPFLPQFVSFPVRIMLLINFNFGQFRKKKKKKKKKKISFGLIPLL